MSKTLQLALEPMPETAKKLDELNKIQSDIEINSKAETAKKILDRFHLSFMSDCLVRIMDEITWEGLYEAMLQKDEKATREERIARLKSIQAIFESTQGYEYITTPTPSKLMQDVLIPANPNEPALQIQAMYLQPFHIARQNLYGNKKGSMCSRIIYDNFPLYFKNILAWKMLETKCPEKTMEILAAIKKKDIAENLESFFSPEGYNRCLTQKGIETYNTILNGFTDENGIYHFGISKMVNDLRKGEDTKNLFEAKEWPVFNKLKKMLMQEMTESFSFIPKQFGSDKEMFEAVYTFCKRMTADNMLGSISDAIDNLKNGVILPEEILVFKDRLSNISNEIYGKWNTIEDTIQKFSEEHFKTKKAAKKFNSEKTITVAQLSEIMKLYEHDEDILSYWTKIDLAKELRILETAALILEKTLNGAQIKDKKDLLPEMENAFGSLSKTVSKISMLLGGKLSKKESFENTAFKYIEDEISLLHKECHFLFCTTRAWCTRKPYETKKIELNFGFPAFGEGFAESVIAQKGCMIFRKEREYFLGILNSNNKPNVADLYTEIEEGSKMHSLFSYSMRAMSITRIIFSKANKKMFESIGLNDDIIDGYEKKLYKTDKTFLEKLIGLTIDALQTYPAWKKINWDLGSPRQYNSWKEFSDTVSEQAVTIEMHQCSEKVLNEMVQNGNIFLFKITSHGMKKYEKGVPTKDKMSEFFIRAVENINNEGESKVALLNNCSVYYRPASIKAPFVHKKGDVLVDKKDINGCPIPGNIYKEIFHYYTHGEKNFSNLSDEAKSMIKSKLVKTKPARFELVKDRRFAMDMFMLHIPVTVNADAPLTLDTDESVNRALDTVNEEANRMFAENGNVIGLTRGSNHLVSYCVINKDKGILAEGDFDVIEERNNNGLTTQSLDYRAKLDQINAARKERAKTWQERGDIAGIQDGYLKSVIRETIRLSEKYNALIILEDMSAEICAKSIMSKIESTSYRKFEASLLESLSCYVPDKRNIGKIVQYSIGNRGTRDNTGQNGRVIFVPTARLQNTDPATGFYNLFGKLGEIETKEKIRKFFSTFKTIEAKEVCVEFTFNYSDFGISDLREMKDSWKLRITGDRFSFELDENDKRNKKKLVVRQPAQEFINFMNGKEGDFKSAIMEDEITADELKKLKNAFFLGLRTRLCAKVNNEEIDCFVSAACDDNDNTFISGSDKGYPCYTDTVLAYNIAMKYFE